MRRSQILILLFCLGHILLANPSSKMIRGEFESILPEGKVNGLFEFHILEESNGLTFNQKNSISESKSLFDNNLNFISISRKYYKNDESNIIELLKHDYYSANLNKNKNELIINYELEGKKLKSKKVKIKGSYRVFDNLYLTLQKDLQNGIGDYNSFLIFPESGKGYKASFNFYKTTNLLDKSTLYKNLPDFFIENSKFDENVIVCEISLLGIAGKFFPHKFNFVFKNNGNKDYLGYWGGNPQTPNYNFVQNIPGEK